MNMYYKLASALQYFSSFTREFVAQKHALSIFRSLKHTGNLNSPLTCIIQFS